MRKTRDNSFSRFSLVWWGAALIFVGAALRPLTSHAALPLVPAAAAGMNQATLDRIDALVEKAIDEEKMPGCVVVVGRRGKTVFRRAYGARRVEPEREAMTIDTVFDLASLTKPIATATSVMLLWERGKLQLDDRVSKHLPEFTGHRKEEITVLELLTHQGGLIPDNGLSDYRDGPEQAWQKIVELSLSEPPGERFIYSDVGFIVLGKLVERLSGQGLDEFARQNIFEPTGMLDTCYLPPDELKERAAPTEKRDGQWIQGSVHDPRAYLMGGVAGHAGLFSTADDLAQYADMMLNQGVCREQCVLAPTTVQKMTEDVAIEGGRRTTVRGLGWDKRSGYSSNRGATFSSGAFGHGGFTGTVIWMDPELDLFFVFLSNRVHPNGKGAVNHLAGQIGTIAAAAIEKPSPSDSNANAVRTGLDVLCQQGFELLKGQRVGLITNHTGIDHAGNSNVAIMHGAEAVDLRAIFSPEHGIAGKLDEPNIGNAKDEQSGLPIYSLYGQTRKPTEDQLRDLDTLVFDIQDIGCRYYTYISTMGLAMEAAAEQGKRFVVLDRPNPIGGHHVAGPVLDDGRQSFVGFHTIPVRHGMTAGELARMLRAERGWELDLEVVAVEGWSRDQYFDATGLVWVNPSPNMRNMNQALLYPGTGLLETTNLSVGRGTDTPFELFGAPWLDARRLAKELNAMHLPGVQFMPREFTPSSSVYAGKLCQGVQISITDRAALRPCRMGLAIARTLRVIHPEPWQVDRYMRLLGNQQVLDAVRDTVPLEELWRLAESDLDEFLERRAMYLIY